MTWQKLKTEVYTHRTHLLYTGLFTVLWLFLLIVPPMNMNEDAGWWGPAMWITLMLFFGLISGFSFIGTWNKEVNAVVWTDFGTSIHASYACVFCDEHGISYKRAKAKKDEEQSVVGFLNEEDLVLVKMSV